LFTGRLFGCDKQRSKENRDDDEKSQQVNDVAPSILDDKGTEKCANERDEQYRNKNISNLLTNECAGSNSASDFQGLECEQRPDRDDLNSLQDHCILTKEKSLSSKKRQTRISIMSKLGSMDEAEMEKYCGNSSRSLNLSINEDDGEYSVNTKRERKRGSMLVAADNEIAGEIIAGNIKLIDLKNKNDISTSDLKLIDLETKFGKEETLFSSKAQAPPITPPSSPDQDLDNAGINDCSNPQFQETQATNFVDNIVEDIKVRLEDQSSDKFSHKSIPCEKSTSSRTIQEFRITDLEVCPKKDERVISNVISTNKPIEGNKDDDDEHSSQSRSKVGEQCPNQVMGDSSLIVSCSGVENASTDAMQGTITENSVSLDFSCFEEDQKKESMENNHKVTPTEMKVRDADPNPLDYKMEGDAKFMNAKREIRVSSQHIYDGRIKTEMDTDVEDKLKKYEAFASNSSGFAEGLELEIERKVSNIIDDACDKALEMLDTSATKRDCNALSSVELTTKSKEIEMPIIERRTEGASIGWNAHESDNEDEDIREPLLESSFDEVEEMPKEATTSLDLIDVSQIPVETTVTEVTQLENNGSVERNKHEIQSTLRDDFIASPEGTYGHGGNILSFDRSKSMRLPSKNVFDAEEREMRPKSAT